MLGYASQSVIQAVILPMHTFLPVPVMESAQIHHKSVFIAFGP